MYSLKIYELGSVWYYSSNTDNVPGFDTCIQKNKVIRLSIARNLLKIILKNNKYYFFYPDAYAKIEKEI